MCLELDHAFASDPITKRRECTTCGLDYDLWLEQRIRRLEQRVLHPTPLRLTDMPVGYDPRTEIK